MWPQTAKGRTCPRNVGRGISRRRMWRLKQFETSLGYPIITVFAFIPSAVNLTDSLSRAEATDQRSRGERGITTTSTAGPTTRVREVASISRDHLEAANIQRLRSDKQRPETVASQAVVGALAINWNLSGCVTRSFPERPRSALIWH
jgi:hypothetical protein